MKPIIALLLTACGLAGCSSGGIFPSGHVTDVQLQRNNFKIVAYNVSGRSSAGYILGGTVSMGMATNTVAVARVKGTGLLYQEALEDLWKNFRASHGAIEGRQLALINVRYDSDALNLLLYTEPTVVIRADIVEFID